MRRAAILLAGTAFAAFAAPAIAQDNPPAETIAADTGDEEIVVTARKRDESLQDVPVAVTAFSGDLIERRGLATMRDVAALTPGLNVSGDGVGRAFVAIRGVGTTLVETVQPGVGIFIDGVYQPNTSILNNPLFDVERIEVLRGPQGTLYGKNTLGGAINIISRQPGNELEGTLNASYAGPDDAWLASASISGPIIADRLQVRVAAAHREQDGFLRNTTLGIDANPLNSDTLSGTIRATLADEVILTVNGYYEWIEGTNTPYSRIAGPSVYSREVVFNAANRVSYRYRGINARLAFPLAGIDTDVTLVAAYDARNGRSPDSDVDFSAAEIARASGTNQNDTTTFEARFDSRLSSTVSTLFGLFYSHESTGGDGTTTIIPLARAIRDISATDSDTYAAFGNIFWRPNDGWEVAAGLRVDNNKRNLTGQTGIIGVGIAPVPEANIDETEVSPRLSLTRHWSTSLMSYASVARGFRGGGFNVNPRAPNRTYSGDSVWAYELGTKYQSSDRRVSLSAALFYNDYRDFIGLNSIAPLAGGGFATIDLNTGDVESYGAEFEATFRPVPAWSISGGLTLMHARITDSTIYTALTGRQLGSDRLPFQPDWTMSLSSDYVVPLGSGELVFNAGVTGKGSRIGASLNETFAPVLDDYFLVNAGITYRIGGFELTAFANNLFDADYWESYIERTTLVLAGLIPSDLGITGDRARYGVRARFRF